MYSNHFPLLPLSYLLKLAKVHFLHRSITQRNLPILKLLVRKFCCYICERKISFLCTKCNNKTWKLIFLLQNATERLLYKENLREFQHWDIQKLSFQQTIWKKRKFCRIKIICLSYQPLIGWTGKSVIIFHNQKQFPLPKARQIMFVIKRWCLHSQYFPYLTPFNDPFFNL